MTRKDYEIIARALNTAQTMTTERAGVGVTAYLLASELAKDNPRFNRDLFLKACGVN